MAPRSKADVIITVYPLASAVLDCVETLLEYSGDELGRLILIDDCCLPSSLVESFEDLAGRDSPRPFRPPFSEAGRYARVQSGVGSIAIGDAVLLSGDCIVSEYWLSELAAVAHSEERTACASPLMNGAGICSVPELNRELDPDETTAVKVRTACAGLPRWTVAPLLNASVHLLASQRSRRGRSAQSRFSIALRGDQQLGIPVPVAGFRGEASQSCLRPSRQRPGPGNRSDHVAGSRADSIGSERSPYRASGQDVLRISRWPSTGPCDRGSTRWKAPGRLRHPALTAGTSGHTDLRRLSRERAGRAPRDRLDPAGAPS